jgi:hypothetical protein
MMAILIEEFTVTDPLSREELLDRLLRSIARAEPVKNIILQPMNDGVSPRENLEFTVTLTSHEFGQHFFAGTFYEGFDKFAVNLTVPREGVNEPATVKITLI